MKQLLALFLLFASFTTIQAQEIKWITLEEALAKQKKVSKPVFINVYTDWYAPCKMLDKETFQDTEFVDFINKNYYAVKFNAEGDTTINYLGFNYDNPSFDANRTGRNSAHEFTKMLKVQVYPSMYVINKKGEIEKPITGYKTASELLNLLK